MTSFKRKKHLIFILLLILGLSFTFKENIILFGLNIISPFNENLSENLINNMDTKTVSTESNRIKSIIENENYSIYMPVTISEGHCIGYKILDYQLASKIIEKYNHFLISTNKENDFLDYQKNVSLALWFAGQSNKAIEIIESIDLKNIKEKKRDEINIIKAGFYLSFSEFDKVSKILEKVNSIDYKNLKELISKSNKNFSNPSIKYDLKDYKASNKIKIDRYFKDLRKYCQSPKYEVKNKNYEISGYITDNGKPMSGVVIYINPNSGISSSNSLDGYTVSDKNGYYEIKGFDYERFHLSLEIPWNRIANKQLSSKYNEKSILFSNKNKSISKNFKFTDAAKIKSLKIENNNLIYEIYDPSGSSDRIYHLTSKTENYKNMNSMYSSITIKNENLKGSIPLNKLRSSFNIPYSNHGYEGDLILENFLEPLYLENDYIFNISISSSNNNNFYVTNGFFSNSLGKKIHIKSPYTLSIGDKFLDKNEFEKAIKWFKNNESEHAYKVLSALYSRGYIINSENTFSFERDGQNLEKALIYKKKLYELNPENTTYILNLIWAYKDLKMYDEEYSLIIKYKNMDISNYGNFLMAENKINQGNLLEGLEIYLEYANPITDYDDYFNYIFLSNETINLTEPYINHFADFNLGDFKPFFNFMRNGKYEEGYEWLGKSKNLNKISNDLIEFYLLLYMDKFKRNDFDDFMDYYVEKTNTIKNSNLKWILRELKYNSNWF